MYKFTIWLCTILNPKISVEVNVVLLTLILIKVILNQFSKVLIITVRTHLHALIAMNMLVYM
jgi:hypothetical protein